MFFIANTYFAFKYCIHYKNEIYLEQTFSVNKIKKSNKFPCAINFSSNCMPRNPKFVTSILVILIIIICFLGLFFQKNLQTNKISSFNSNLPKVNSSELKEDFNSKNSANSSQNNSSFSQNSSYLSSISPEKNSQNSSESVEDFLKTEKLKMQKISQTLTKIDTSQKPFLLTETQLLGQNKQNLLPEIGSKQYLKNPKPIFVESEKTLYFPYITGFIARINIETGEVKWDTFDFAISQMSLFNGNYYLTEYKKGCIGTAQTTGVDNTKCRIIEINRRNLKNQKTLLEVNSDDLYVAFANGQNFWLATGFSGAGEASSIGFSKYKKSGEFVENFSLGFFLSYIQEDWLTPKYRNFCPNETIYQEIKDKNTTLGLEFDYEKDQKKVWVSPYNDCKTVEDQQKAHTDKKGKQIFQSKFPFDISKIMNNGQIEAVSCDKWQYKLKNPEEKYDFQLFWDNQEFIDYQGFPINCLG